ncbi:hypothetical protein F5Y07DRAFT_397795 [Xylaria sp. FL0933]|nr:hypothetical protein F5Y07DRAFT_397795 [Xylaria sp. FL0933]
MSNHQLNRDRVPGAQREPRPDAAVQIDSSQHQEQSSRGYVRRLETYIWQQSTFIQQILRGWLPGPATQTHPGHHPLSINPNFQEVVPKGVMAEVFQNRAELRRMNEDFAQKIEECDKLRARLQTSDEELTELRGIKGVLNKKIQECEQIKENWQAAVGELSDLKSSKFHFMVDDAEMIAKWKNLQYSIKNLARSYLCHVLPEEGLSSDQISLLKSVTPYCEVLLDAEGQVHLLFQALVWMKVTKYILWNPTMVWGQTVSEAAQEVFKHGPDSLENYHAWRAETGQIIQEKSGVSETQKTSLKTDMYSMVVGFLPGAMPRTDRDATIIHRSVDAIIDKAIELAVVFNQSRCLYTVKEVTHRQVFESEMMEFYDEECCARKVDFMISPALTKNGNALGKHYHQRLILAKSCVYSYERDTPRDGGDEQELIEL